MAIHRIGGNGEESQVVCDICDDAGPVGDTWWDCKYKADAAGWKTTKIAGSWENYCPDCEAKKNES